MTEDETLPTGDPPAVSAPAPGGRIGKYEILRALGSGGMGVVWAARDPDLDREVAIKLLRSADASSELRTRLLREARAMARLKHPNVLTVYEVDSDGTRDFIAMELVDGVSLDVWLHERPPAREVWDALLAAGRGLAAAHAAGLVHRDFKPHNVLRSRDGRVLVTDFGLARGHADVHDAVAVAPTLPPNAALEATLDAAASKPSAGDSVLDLRLTTTGQLLGTPAYMAPEQFAGVTPDPRTDQFAYCVALWEALSGERPFAGSTVEELERETSAGRVRGDAKLVAAVRRVLVRGLAPDRANRWPDMPSVLHALERARTTWRRRGAVIVPVFGLSAAALLLATRPSATKAPAPCEPGEAVFATTWSPAIRADLLAKHPQATAIADLLDDYKGRWLTGYAKECQRDPAPRPAAVSCYLSKRDEASVLVELAQRFEPEELVDVDLRPVISSSELCAGDDPIASPRLPDGDRGTRATALLAKLYAGESKPSDLLATQAALRDEATAIGWPPLAAKVEEVIAMAAQRSGKRDVAHAAYVKAAELASDNHDYLGEARARLAVLEIGRDEIIDESPKQAYADELRSAELAVKNAGNDPGLVASLDRSRAAHAVYADHDLSAGIQLLDQARMQFQIVRDHRRGPQTALELADVLTVRAAPGDLARATELVAEARKTMQQAGYHFDRMDFAERTPFYWVAWLDGDLAGAHAALDVLGTLNIPLGPVIRGHVVDETGHPVAGAQVVAWRGDLFGDALREWTDPIGSRAHATTDANGEFTIAAAEGGGLIAELGARRSLPIPSAPGARLVLAPTRAISGRVDVGGDPAIGVEPFAQIDVTPKVRWAVSTAPSADGHFTIAGIPATAHPTLGAVGSHWPREQGRRILVGPATDGAEIHWPVGPPLYFTMKAKFGTVWILRGHVSATTRAGVEQLARDAPDSATVPITPVGWANPAAALDLSLAGDHHAVILDNTPGDVTMCTVHEMETQVGCSPWPVSGQKTPVLRDGRHWFE